MHPLCLHRTSKQVVVVGVSLSLIKPCHFSRELLVTVHVDAELLYLEYIVAVRICACEVLLMYFFYANPSN